MDTQVHDALLNAILASPKADLPRLVYADFLEENAGMKTCRWCNGTTFRAAGKWESDYRMTCPECRGAGVLPDDRMRQAAFIRAQIDGEKVDLPHGLQWTTCESVMEEEGRLVATSAGQVQVCGNHVSLVWRRGFVDEIRCSFGWWVGIPCGVCDGDPSAVPCHRCDDTGSTPSHGPTLVAAHPVTKVTISDRWPMYLPSRGPPLTWVEENSDVAFDDGQVIPADVARHMTGVRKSYYFILGGFDYREYDDEVAARADLSQALLKWAKEQKRG